MRGDEARGAQVKTEGAGLGDAGRGGTSPRLRGCVRLWRLRQQAEVERGVEVGVGGG